MMTERAGVVVSVPLSDQLYHKVRSVANRQFDGKRASLIRKAVELYVDTELKKIEKREKNDE